MNKVISSKAFLHGTVVSVALSVGKQMPMSEKLLATEDTNLKFISSLIGILCVFPNNKKADSKFFSLPFHGHEVSRK